MLGIPGLKTFATLPKAPVRSLWSNPTSLFAIAGPTLYQVFGDGTFNALGDIPNGTNPAIIVSNGFQLAIATAGEAWIAPGGPGPGTRPINGTDGQPVPAATIAFLDQYFIAAEANSKRIRISNFAPAGGVWDPGDAAIKETYSDNISRVWVDQPGGKYLWLFGNETTEIWGDTAGLFPFSLISGQVYPIGCDSAWSVAGAGGFRAWLWRGVVYGCTGFQPQRISDYGVEQAIKGFSQFDQYNAESFSWIDGGHIYYAISFPVSGRTFVYDRATQTWHERLYYQNGQYGRYRGRVYAKAFGMDLVGDYANGNIYQMDPATYTDAGGVALRRERICPYLTDGMLNTRFNRLTIDMDTGVGLQVPVGQLGQDPQVIMKYSKDRGKTFSYERQASAGPIGDSQQRVIFTQLGSSRIGMVFDVVVTDPVPVLFNTSYVDVSRGTWPRN